MIVDTHTPQRKISYKEKIVNMTKNIYYYFRYDNGIYFLPIICISVTIIIFMLTQAKLLATVEQLQASLVS